MSNPQPNHEQRVCPTCDGSGALPRTATFEGDEPITCPTCHGSGQAPQDGKQPGLNSTDPQLYKPIQPQPKTPQSEADGGNREYANDTTPAGERATVSRNLPREDTAGPVSEFLNQEWTTEKKVAGLPDYGYFPSQIEKMLNLNSGMANKIMASRGYRTATGAPPSALDKDREDK